MRILRLLPERWQKFIREVLKFGTVGGINTVINFAVFNALALTVLADGQLKATVVAAIVATTTSYFMNRHWTYRDRPRSALRREYLLFFLFNITGLLIEVGILALAKYGFGMTGLLALNIVKVFGLALGTVFRFWAYRTFVFRPAPSAPPVDPESAPPVDAPSAPPVDPESASRIPQQGAPKRPAQVPDSPATLSDPTGIGSTAGVAAGTRPGNH
ncbi:GtrA family protein [Micromonospora sp. NBC_01813]|jgi:putative flippase GtrA|uniref:GtrA family protein n=1 Tax=Micromonospora sp. NBC_01813 TaxID=2975988 RepID=UPI002DDB92DA|nr:GtrA family protein [Micromonospora sp. NBC_01813]WSA12416.1 GtrA family protein [Micromonospora sp. NBC_01813]